MIANRINFIQETFNIKCTPPSAYTKQEIALNQLIDHTVLSQDATPDQITTLCEEAKKYNFKAVCINGCYAEQCLEQLKGSQVKTCCVINFPLGNATTEQKVFEATSLTKMGVSEIDMVLNCGFMKSHRYNQIFNEIKQIAEACHQNKAMLKVIIEATCLELDELIIDACLLSVTAGADFVKTSTGMHKNGGAKPEHVKLMRETVGGNCGVKAAGGVRDEKSVMEMVEAGADRIGTSGGVKIVNGQVHGAGY